MDTYSVPVALLVEDDDREGARATVQTILTSAGGSDVEGAGTFGFILDAPLSASEAQELHRLIGEYIEGGDRNDISGLIRARELAALIVAATDS